MPLLDRADSILIVVDADSGVHRRRYGTRIRIVGFRGPRVRTIVDAAERPRMRVRRDRGRAHVAFTWSTSRDHCAL